MYPDLEGKVAVVTGAGSGLGAGIARRFLDEGMSVVVNYHSERTKLAAYDLANEYNIQAGPLQRRAAVVQADLSQEEGAQRLLDAALECFGGLDVWVNNAGIESRHPTHELPLEAWNQTIATNLTGVFLGSRAALKRFVDSETKGSIINISSVHERVPWPTFAAYAASKGGVKMLTETIALEYASRGIRANCIAPGAIQTPINAEKFADPAALEMTLTMIPNDRIGTVHDVAEAAAWLASDVSSYVTGHSLFVDGGMSLYPSFERGDG